MRIVAAVGVTLTLLALLPACQPKAPPASAVAPGFASEIQAFTDWDARNASPANPIVFAGSSSIRLWNTAQRFAGLPIVNRGFGGSQMTDVNQYVKETVIRYSPRIVVLYAGDNDINAGRTADQVFAEYETFARAVLDADSTTDIVFLPIKPSLQRWALWPVMRALNERVRAYAKASTHLHYVDLATPMLGPDAKPRPDLFIEDGLHMTPAGYDVWSTGLKPLLDSLSARPRRAVKGAAAVL